MCRKHEKAQNWLRVNHDPSMGVDNIGNMRIAIGYEHIQVNTIRVVAGTKTQENLNCQSRKSHHHQAISKRETEEVKSTRQNKKL